MLHRPTCAGVVSRPRVLLPRQVDYRLHRFGGLWVQRNHALGVALADRDTQPWMPVGVGVEAVDGETADLVTTGPAPPRDDQRGPLIWIEQLVDRGHEGGEFVVGDEPRHRMVDLAQTTRGSAASSPWRSLWGVRVPSGFTSPGTNANTPNRSDSQPDTGPTMRNPIVRGSM